VNHFPASITNLPDEELLILQAELEACDFMSRDQWDYDEDSWEWQAKERWSDIVGELRRRNGPAPKRPMLCAEEIVRMSLEAFRITFETHKPIEDYRHVMGGDTIVVKKP